MLPFNVVEHPIGWLLVDPSDVDIPCFYLVHFLVGLSMSQEESVFFTIEPSIFQWEF